jgi:hypothetical protein
LRGKIVAAAMSLSIILSAACTSAEAVTNKTISRIPASEFKDVPLPYFGLDYPDLNIRFRKRTYNIDPKPVKRPTRHLKPKRVYRPVIAVSTAQRYALRVLGPVQYQCVYNLFSRESGWRVSAYNASSGAYGIPQAVPGSKMALFGSDWRTNPITQVRWGIYYVNHRYGSACSAWSFWQYHRWY